MYKILHARLWRAHADYIAVHLFNEYITCMYLIPAVYTVIQL